MRITKADLRHIRALSLKKVRLEENKFLMEGWRGLKEVLNSTSKVEMVAVVSRYLEDPDYQGILAKLQQRGAEIRQLTDTELKGVADTVHSQGVLAVVQQKKFELDPEKLRRSSLVVAADAVTDPGNLGSVIRSADWFNVDLLLLGRGCVDLYNEKVVRSTVGSILHIPHIEGVDLPSVLETMKTDGFSILAFSGDGKQSYVDQKVDQNVVLVFGSEAHGVSREIREIAHATVRIPKYGKADSLNVGVACGIVLAHIRYSRDQKKSD